MARTHFEYASQLGDTKAKIALGEMVFDKSDLSKAEPHYKAAADLGDLSGKFRLAQIYKHLGRKEEAHQLYLEAAQGGHARAAFDIGLNYFNGTGCTPNIEECLKWLKIASAKGISKAMYNLAVIYCYGMNIDQNIYEALEWTLKSVEFGSKEGRELLQKLAPLQKRIVTRGNCIPDKSKLRVQLEKIRTTAPTAYLKAYFEMAYDYVSLLDLLKPGEVAPKIRTGC